MDVTFLRRLLPVSWVWRLPYGGALRRLLDAVADVGADSRAWVSDRVADTFASFSGCVGEWEHEYGLATVPELSDAERRARIVAAAGDWGALGLDECEAAVRAMGFDVRLYEWWVYAHALGMVAPENLHVYRNHIRVGTQKEYTDHAGNSGMYAGGAAAFAGYFTGRTTIEEAPTLSGAETVEGIYAYAILVAGEYSTTPAVVPAERWNELVDYLIQRLPAEQWIILHATET